MKFPSLSENAMVKRRFGIALLVLVGLFVPLLLADVAEAGVLYTGRVRVVGGDQIECAGVNVSSVTLPIKLDLLDGDGGGVIASVNCPAILPGTNGGTSGCDSELFHQVSVSGGFDALCRITVDGFPANFVRANMVVHFSPQAEGIGAGSISTDGIPAPVTFRRPLPPGLLDQFLDLLQR